MQQRSLGRWGLGAVHLLCMLMAVWEAHAQQSRVIPTRLLQPNTIPQAQLYNGTQLTTIRGGDCIAIKLPAGQLTLNKVVFSAVSMTFTNISTLVSSCPLNPAGKMTNLMVAVLRSDQVPPGVPLPSVMRKRRPQPGDAALVASMSRQCSMTAGDGFIDTPGDATSEPSAAGSAVLGSKAKAGDGNDKDKFGTYYQMAPQMCDALRQAGAMTPWSAARNNFTFAAVNVTPGGDQPAQFKQDAATCMTISTDLRQKTLIRNLTTQTTCADTEMYMYIYNCHSSANNPTWTNDQLKFMVLADMQAEPVPQDTCFGGKAKALQRFTVAYSYLLIAFLALIAVLWIGSTIPGLITSVQKWRRKRREAAEQAATKAPDVETADGTTTKDSASSGCLGKLPWRKAPPAAASDKAGAGKDGKETGDEDDDKSSVVSSVASRSALGGWVGRGRAILQVLSYDVCFPAGRSRAYLTMQIASAALLAAAIAWPPAMKASYAQGLSQVVFSYALTPADITGLGSAAWRWAQVTGLSLLIGANLYLSLLSALCMHPEDPRLQGKDLLVPRFDRPLSRRAAFTAQQVVSTVALGLHNVLVASFIMSMGTNLDTWRFPEPYILWLSLLCFNTVVADLSYIWMEVRKGSAPHMPYANPFLLLARAQQYVPGFISESPVFTYPALMLAGMLTSGQLLIVWYVLNMMTAASWSACAAAPVPCLTDLASRTLSTNVASVLVDLPLTTAPTLDNLAGLVNSANSLTSWAADALNTLQPMFTNSTQVQDMVATLDEAIGKMQDVSGLLQTSATQLKDGAKGMAELSRRIAAALGLPTLTDAYTAAGLYPWEFKIISVVGYTLGLLLGLYNIVMLAKHYKQLCITYEVLLPNKLKNKPGLLKPADPDPQQQEKDAEEDEDGPQPSPRPGADGAYVATVSNEALRKAVAQVGLARRFQVATTVRRRAVGTPNQSMNGNQAPPPVSTRWLGALDAIQQQQAAAKAAKDAGDKDVTSKDQDQGGYYLDEEVSELVLPEQDRARAEALRVAAAASLFGATVSMSWVVMNVAANLIVLGLAGLVVITRIYPVLYAQIMVSLCLSVLAPMLITQVFPALVGFNTPLRGIYYCHLYSWGLALLLMSSQAMLWRVVMCMILALTVDLAALHRTPIGIPWLRAADGGHAGFCAAAKLGALAHRQQRQNATPLDPNDCALAKAINEALPVQGKGGCKCWGKPAADEADGAGPASA